MTSVRNDCLNLITEILENHRPTHLVIAEYLNVHRELGGADKGFVSRLVRGTVERMITLDYVINSVSSTKVSKCKPAIRNILRMGTYQLLYMEVPDSAACNESVKLAKLRNFGNLSGFVNGNLRSIVRLKDDCKKSASAISLISDEKPEVPEQYSDNSVEINPVIVGMLKKDRKMSLTKKMSVMFSVPEWIVNYFVSNYGEVRAVNTFKYFLEDSRTNICTVSSKIRPEELKKRLENEDISVDPSSIPGSFSINNFGSLESLPEFKEGLFFVQDISSTMAVNQAEFHVGDRVLDLCAAPGGKTMHAADLLLMVEAEQTFENASGHKETDLCPNKSEVISCDISERKVALIKQNIERCGFTNVHTEVNDATVLREDFVDSFDVVLCDVPCSGLGIIGRKPDIKYNMTPEGQAELVELQREILDNAVRYVREGGQFIFSTCTVNKAENQENVDYIKTKGLKCITSRQLLPGEEGTDGFFYAKFVR